MFGSKSLALVSNGAIWQPDGMTSSRLKFATLLFDRLIFVGKYSDIIAEYIFSEDINKAEITAPVRTAIKECWTDTEGIAPNFSMYVGGTGLSRWPWHSAPEQLKETTRAVLEEVYASDASAEARYEVYKLGGYLMSDIIYWSEHFGNTSFIGDDLTEEVLRRTNFSLINESNDPIKWYETNVPNCSNVSWKDILDLRKSEFLKAFRQKHTELSMSGEIERVFDLYYETLERLADVVKPSLAKEMAKGVLGNIPFLPVNPVAIAASAGDIYKVHKLKKDFGWVFFLRALREAQNVDLSPNQPER